MCRMRLVKRPYSCPAGVSLLFAACLAALLAVGCGGKSKVIEGEAEAPTIRKVSADKLPALDEYLPPLDDGKLELAGPKDWKRMSREAKYLARFVKGDPLGLPRVLVTAEQADIAQFETADEENVVEFANIIGARLKDGKATVLEPSRPMMIGQHAFARYVLRAKFKNANIERQMLQTLVGGRLYTIDLQVADGELLKHREHRDAAYAVAAGLKFSRGKAAAAP